MSHHHLRASQQLHDEVGHFLPSPLERCNYATTACSGHYEGSVSMWTRSYLSALYIISGQPTNKVTAYKYTAYILVCTTRDNGHGTDQTFGTSYGARHSKIVMRFMCYANEMLQTPLVPFGTFIALTVARCGTDQIRWYMSCCTLDGRYMLSLYLAMTDPLRNVFYTAYCVF